MDVKEFIASIIGLLCATAILVTLGLTTHASNINKNNKNLKEMTVCLQSQRSAAECRVAIYGTP